MLLIILLVCFVMTLFAWALALAGGFPLSQRGVDILAFVACLILGLVVFLAGFGTPLMRPP